MTNPKPSGESEELSPESKFQQAKQMQRKAGANYSSDRGVYLKSARQIKEEEKAAKEAAKKASKPAPEPVTRREFLNYAWGAAMAFVLVETGIASFQFALPRFKEGEFGGIFNLGEAANMPPVGAAPLQNLDGAFWLVNDDDGARALYRVCTHLGCLYEWKDQTSRFECPCHGSKFEHNGKYIEGPAPRSLDQFAMSLEKDGQVIATTNEGGQALPLTDLSAVVLVDTGAKLKGPST